MGLSKENERLNLCTTFQEKKRQKYLEFFDAILAKKIPAKKRDFWIQERFAFIFLQRDFIVLLLGVPKLNLFSSTARHLQWDRFFRLLYGLGRNRLKFFPQHPPQSRFQSFLFFMLQNCLHQKGVFPPFRHSLQNFPCSAVRLVPEVGAEAK